MRAEDKIIPHLQAQAFSSFLGSLTNGRTSFTQDEIYSLKKRAYEYINQEYFCIHSESQLAFIEVKNGTKMFQRQCSDCFEKITPWIAYAKLDPNEREKAVPRVEIDYQYLATARYVARDQAEKYLDLFCKENDWWAWYQKYLQSPKWQQKRTKALKRDNYICQSCLEKRATQVHHKSYEMVGDEPLFDLESVCDDCHDRITKAHREKQNGKR